MTGFLNDNQGWWGFLAVPPALAAVLIGLSQLYQTSKTTRLSDRERWQALLATMVRNRSLALRQRRGDFQLPVRLLDPTGTTLADPAKDLVAHLVGGGCAEVVGEAGSGKSYLAVEVREAAMDAAADVVVDVVSARDWRPRSRKRFGRSAGDQDLAAWASAALQQRYRIFRRSYLRRLIDEGRIILAVDGFDEVEQQAADGLWQAILDHATRLPLLVLRRSGGSVSAVTTERLSFYEFARYEVKPLGEIAVATFLRERFPWYDELSQARRPDQLRLMLTNPLRLHLATQIWSRTRPPPEILAAENPDKVLWSTFLREKLDRSALGRQDRRLRRVVQALALSADSSTMRLNESFDDSRTRVLMMVPLALTVLPLGWIRGTPEVAVLALCAAFRGMRPQFRETILGVRVGHFDDWRLAVRVADGAIGALLFAVGYWLLVSVTYLVTIVSLGMRDLGMNPAEVLTDTDAIPLWWDYMFEVGWITLPSPWFGAVFSLLFIASFNSTVVLRFVPGWQRLPFPYDLWLLALAAGLLVAVPDVPSLLWVFGVLVLSTVLYTVIRLVLYADYVGSPRCTSPKILRSLEELGIVYQDRGRFRLVHQEIADNVAGDVLEREDELPRHARMITLSRAEDIITTMVLHDDARVMTNLTRRLLRQYPDSDYLASSASMLFTYGAQDLTAALRLGRRFTRRQLGAHLAETYFALGETDRARAVMADTVRLLPSEPYVLVVASTMAIALDDVDEGIRVLRDALARMDGSDRSYIEMRLAIAESQWDRVPDAVALAQLDALSSVDNPYRSAAVLEAARRWSECRDEHDRAATALVGLEREGFDEIVSARLAQVHLRLGDHDKAAWYARRVARELRWDSDVDTQLEAAITADAATGDPLAHQVATRLAGYGWRVTERLAAIDRDLRALRSVQ